MMTISCILKVKHKGTAIREAQQTDRCMSCSCCRACSQADNCSCSSPKCSSTSASRERGERTHHRLQSNQLLSISTINNIRGAIEVTHYITLLLHSIQSLCFYKLHNKTIHLQMIRSYIQSTSSYSQPLPLTCHLISHVRRKQVQVSKLQVFQVVKNYVKSIFRYLREFSATVSIS